MKTQFGETIIMSEQIPYQTPVKLMASTNANICNVHFLKGEEVETMFGLWSAIKTNPNNFTFDGEQIVHLVAVAKKDPRTKEYIYESIGNKGQEIVNKRLKELEEKLAEKEKVQEKEQEKVQEQEQEPKVQEKEQEPKKKISRSRANPKTNK